MLKPPFWASLWARPRFLESGPACGGAPLESVRLAMRALVLELPGTSGARLLGSIERAQDLQTLWFLRSGLMQALASGRGESGARVALAELDALFRQGWPEAPVSRVAALG